MLLPNDVTFEVMQKSLFAETGSGFGLCDPSKRLWRATFVSEGVHATSIFPGAK